MNLNLNEDQLNSVISGAILQALTPETRDKLLKDAIVSLMSNGKDSYGLKDAKTSPIKDAFDNAAINIARQMATEFMEQDENFRGQIQAMLAKAAEKVFADRDKIIEAMANKLSDALSGSRY